MILGFIPDEMRFTCCLLLGTYELAGAASATRDLQATRYYTNSNREIEAIVPVQPHRQRFAIKNLLLDVFFDQSIQLLRFGPALPGLAPDFHQVVDLTGRDRDYLGALGL